MRTFPIAALGPLAACALAATAHAQPPAPGQPGGVPTSLKPQPPTSLRPPAAQPVLTTPVDPKLDVRAAIEAAKKTAATMRGRVLVIWMPDPNTSFPRAMVDVLATADLRQRLGLEYAVVWAGIAGTENAAANLEIAKSLSAEVGAKDIHPTFSVLSVEGKPLIHRSAIDMVDPVRTNTYTAPTVNDFLAQNAEPPPAAKAITDEAIAKAKESKRSVLLVFGQFGDMWTWRFRSWLGAKDAAAALDKRAIVTHIELLRDRGAFELMETYGGVRVQSLPWYVVLNPDGKSVGTSQPEKMPNIGFPTDEAETAAFCDLLKAGNPAWTEADSKAIRDSLDAFHARKAQ